MASSYAWTIDSDHIDPGRPTPKIGPSNAPTALVDRLRNGEGHPFRMYNDSGDLYYSGRIVGKFDGAEPLDEFGRPNAKATEIWYRERGRWGKLE